MLLLPSLLDVAKANCSPMSHIADSRALVHCSVSKPGHEGADLRKLPLSELLRGRTVAESKGAGYAFTEKSMATAAS